MKLFIPTVGSKFKLTKDWSFSVYSDYRNKSLAKFKNSPYEFNDYYSATKVGFLTIPADSVIKIERIYIRKGKEDYDSLTFSIKSTSLELDPDKKKLHKTVARFWSKLEDCNQIEFEFDA